MSLRLPSLRNGQWAVLVLLSLGVIAGTCAVLYWQHRNPNAPGLKMRGGLLGSIPEELPTPGSSHAPTPGHASDSSVASGGGVAEQLELLRQRYLKEHSHSDLVQLVERLDMFLKEHRAYAPAYVLMGQVLFDQGQTAKALAYVAEGLRLKPDQPQVLLMGGTFALMLPDPVKAQVYFQKAVDLEPTNVKFYLHLGQALFAQQKWDAAAKVFEQALRLDSSAHVAYSSLADIRAKRQDWSGALQFIHKAIEQVPLGKRKQQVVYLQKQAFFLQKSNQIKQALMVLQKLTDTEQAQTQVMSQMAQYWDLLGQPQQAAAIYEKYLAVTPKAWPLAAEAARWRIKAGDWAKAQQHLMYLRLLNAKLPVIAELEQALDKATKSSPAAAPAP